MKSRTLASIITMTVLAALATPSRVAAQSQDSAASAASCYSSLTLGTVAALTAETLSPRQGIGFIGWR
jgi:hypothetical protein